MDLEVAGRQLTTARNADNLFLLVPVHYEKEFGVFDKNYGLQEFFGVWFFYHYRRSALFNPAGVKTDESCDTGVTFLYHYEDSVFFDGTNTKGSTWRFDFINVPLMGPVLGIGKDYLKFFFVPMRKPSPQQSESTVPSETAPSASPHVL